MRKLLFGALALVGMAVCVSCGDKSGEPSLTGKWVSDTLVKNEDKGSVAMVTTLDFKQDSMMARDIKMSYSIEEKGMKMTLPFEVGYDGKYSVANQKIVCKGDTASFRFKMEKDSVKIVCEDATMQALADKMITSMMKNAENEFGGSIKNEAMASDSIPYFFEGETLKVVADGDTLVMHRAQ